MATLSGTRSPVQARLHRIEGQTHALLRLYDEGRPTAELLDLIAAIRAALGGLGLAIIAQGAATARGPHRSRQRMTTNASLRFWPWSTDWCDAHERADPPWSAGERRAGLEPNRGHPRRTAEPRHTRAYDGAGPVGRAHGAAPHVLHHVGPLAGTALVAAAGGRVLFGVAGFVATVPMLRRLRRRTGSWRTPGLALTAFAAIYTVSTLFVGPVLAAATSPDAVMPSTEQVEVDHHGHDVGRD
jgi:DNA-binding FrmR family transcriptional regulator